VCDCVCTHFVGEKTNIDIVKKKNLINTHSVFVCVIYHFAFNAKKKKTHTHINVVCVCVRDHLHVLKLALHKKKKRFKSTNGGGTCDFFPRR